MSGRQYRPCRDDTTMTDRARRRCRRPSWLVDVLLSAAFTVLMRRLTWTRQQRLRAEGRRGHLHGDDAERRVRPRPGVRAQGPRALLGHLHLRPGRHLPASAASRSAEARRASGRSCGSIRWDDAPVDRLYFGKAYIYPVFAAPFVLAVRPERDAGLPRPAAGRRRLARLPLPARRARPAPVALTFTLAFLGVSIVPVYGVWLTPEIFNLSLVFFAYFLWLYKQVGAAGASVQAGLGRFVRGPASDVLAAVLLGMVAFSKPLYVLLAAPVVAWPLWGVWRRGDGAGFARRAGARRAARRRLRGGGRRSVRRQRRGVRGVQLPGGNRRVFYRDRSRTRTRRCTFETVGLPERQRTSSTRPAVLDPRDLAARYARNAVYFLVRPSRGAAAVLLSRACWRWCSGGGGGGRSVAGTC